MGGALSRKRRSLEDEDPGVAGSNHKHFERETEQPLEAPVREFRGKTPNLIPKQRTCLPENHSCFLEENFHLR